MTEKENRIYCWYCGKSNAVTNDRCSECNHKLDEKNHPLLDYIKRQIGDNFRGTVTEKIIAVIKHYLYGITMTIAVAFAITAGVISHMNGDSVPENTKETKTKYTFNALTDEEKLAGCWRVDFSQNDEVKFEVIDKDLRSSVYNIDGEYTGDFQYGIKPYDYLPDPDWFEWPEEAIGRPYLVMSEDAPRGIFVWKDDNNFTVFGLSDAYHNDTPSGKAEIYFARVSCNNMPK